MIIPKMYDVELKSSNYNPDISTSITITATATDYNGNPVIGESLTIKHNGIAVGNAVTTNANGQASVVTTCGSGGTHQFSCKSASCIITVNPYPIGSIYISTNSTDPSTLFGGTWTQIEDRFLLASGSSYALKTNGANTTGGEAEHTLTIAEMPTHYHKTGARQTYGSGNAWGLINYGASVGTQDKNTSSTGGGQAHNNMPPYLVVSVWERVADALFDDITATSTESVLSYLDGDSCTLSAQLTKNGSPASVENVSVEFFNGSTSLGTANTNSNGVATLNYNSTGSGDMSITASVDSIISSEIYVEDCIRYDGATSDKTSNYSSRNLNTFTFNSEHYEAYRSVGTNLTSTFYSPIYADDTLPSDFEMSVMYKASNINSELIEFIIASTHPTTYNGATELGLVVTDARRGLFHRVSGSATWYTESSTLSNDAWYTFYLKVEGTTVTGTILDSNDDIVYTSTQTISAVQNYKKWSIINGGNSRTLHWKELKIKTL